MNRHALTHKNSTGKEAERITSLNTLVNCQLFTQFDYET